MTNYITVWNALIKWPTGCVLSLQTMFTREPLFKKKPRSYACQGSSHKFAVIKNVVIIILFNHHRPHENMMYDMRTFDHCQYIFSNLYEFCIIV